MHLERPRFIKGFMRNKSTLCIDSYGSDDHEYGEDYFFITLDGEQIITESISGGSDVDAVGDTLDTFVKTHFTV